MQGVGNVDESRDTACIKIERHWRDSVVPPPSALQIKFCVVTYRVPLPFAGLGEGGCRPVSLSVSRPGASSTLPSHITPCVTASEKVANFGAFIRCCVMQFAKVREKRLPVVYNQGAPLLHVLYLLPFRERGMLLVGHFLLSDSASRLMIRTRRIPSPSSEPVALFLLWLWHHLPPQPHDHKHTQSKQRR